MVAGVRVAGGQSRRGGASHDSVGARREGHAVARRASSAVAPAPRRRRGAHLGARPGRRAARDGSVARVEARGAEAPHAASVVRRGRRAAREARRGESGWRRAHRRRRTRVGAPRRASRPGGLGRSRGRRGGHEPRRSDGGSVRQVREHDAHAPAGQGAGGRAEQSAAFAHRLDPPDSLRVQRQRAGPDPASDARGGRRGGPVVALLLLLDEPDARFSVDARRRPSLGARARQHDDARSVASGARRALRRALGGRGVPQRDSRRRDARDDGRRRRHRDRRRG